MVPSPPDFREVPPLFHTWERGDPILRVYDHDHPPNSFNPGLGGGIRGRFHFFEDRGGAVVPVMYGSDQEDGAISETIFHDVPVRGADRVVLASRLNDRSLITLAPQRDLKLASLFGHGLRRLEVTAQELTSTDEVDCPGTVAWARALHHAIPDLDGLVWMARQFNAARALVLFGDRVQAGDLKPVSPPHPLRIGIGRSKVDHAANQARIVIV